MVGLVKKKKIPAPLCNYKWLRLFVVIVVIVGAPAAFLPDGNLDALGRETLAEVGTIADAGELLRRVDLEDVAENGSQDKRLARVDRDIILLVRSGLDVAEGEP